MDHKVFSKNEDRTQTCVLKVAIKADKDEWNSQRERNFSQVMQSENRIGRNIIEEEYEDPLDIARSFETERKNLRIQNDIRSKNQLKETKYDEKMEQEVYNRIKDQLKDDEEIEKVTLPENVTVFDLFGVKGSKERKLTRFKQATGCRLAFSRTETHALVLRTPPPI